MPNLRRGAAMTADRERILEILREAMEAHPELRFGQIVEAAANQAGYVGFYVSDRNLVYGLLYLLGRHK